MSTNTVSFQLYKIDLLIFSPNFTNFKNENSFGLSHLKNKETKKAYGKFIHNFVFQRFHREIVSQESNLQTSIFKKCFLHRIERFLNVIETYE